MQHPPAQLIWLMGQHSSAQLIWRMAQASPQTTAGAHFQMQAPQAPNPMQSDAGAVHASQQHSGKGAMHSWTQENGTSDPPGCHAVSELHPTGSQDLRPADLSEAS